MEIGLLGIQKGGEGKKGQGSQGCFKSKGMDLTANPSTYGNRLQALGAEVVF